MSHRRAKKLRTLSLHVEYGGNWPAVARSRATVKEMQPTAKELRRVERYIRYKAAKLQRADERFNLSTHDGCDCPPDQREAWACPIWLNAPD